MVILLEETIIGVVRRTLDAVVTVMLILGHQEPTLEPTLDPAAAHRCCNSL